jgi:hypothetical protein
LTTSYSPGRVPIAFINENSDKIVLGFQDIDNGTYFPMSISIDLKNNSEFHLSGHYFTDE